MRRAAGLTWTAKHRDADKSGEELDISHPLAGTQAALGRLVFSGFDVAGNICSGVFAGWVDGAVDPFDFTAALKDSARALSKHAPRAPADCRMPRRFARPRRPRWYIVYRDRSGISYPGLGGSSGGHGQRVDCQFGAEVAGHGVSDAGFGVAVDDGGSLE
jgi:hypothetical protein